jgi:hypothetical protein
MSHGDPAEHQLVEARLADERPKPSNAFYARLRERLLEEGPVRSPEQSRAQIRWYVGSGVLLLLIVAAGVAGIGPLAA